MSVLIISKDIEVIKNSQNSRKMSRMIKGKIENKRILNIFSNMQLKISILTCDLGKKLTHFLIFKFIIYGSWTLDQSSSLGCHYYCCSNYSLVLFLVLFSFFLRVGFPLFHAWGLVGIGCCYVVGFKRFMSLLLNHPSIDSFGLT